MSKRTVSRFWCVMTAEYPPAAELNCETFAYKRWAKVSLFLIFNLRKVKKMSELFSNAANIQWQQVVMWLIGGLLIYLAIKKDM